MKSPKNTVLTKTTKFLILSLLIISLISELSTLPIKYEKTKNTDEHNFSIEKNSSPMKDEITPRSKIIIVEDKIKRIKLSPLPQIHLFNSKLSHSSSFLNLSNPLYFFYNMYFC